MSLTQVTRLTYPGKIFQDMYIYANFEGISDDPIERSTISKSRYKNISDSLCRIWLAVDYWGLLFIFEPWNPHITKLVSLVLLEEMTQYFVIRYFDKCKVFI